MGRPIRRSAWRRAWRTWQWLGGGVHGMGVGTYVVNSHRLCIAVLGVRDAVAKYLADAVSHVFSALGRRRFAAQAALTSLSLLRRTERTSP